MKAVVLFFIVLAAYSCGFNSLYYVPYPLDITMKPRLIDRSTGDTTLIRFVDSYQPIFMDTKSNPKKMDFTANAFQVLSENGNYIFGWTLKPARTQVKARICFLHGNAGNVLTHYTGLEKLIKLGYEIYLFDYSGFGFSKGKPNRKNVLQDAEAVLQMLNEEEQRSLPIVIYGQSLGGHLASVLAAKHPSQFDALVIEGAFSSHKDIAAKDFKFLGRLFVKEGYAGYKYISQVKKPVLIIHSTEDETIPFSHGQKLFKHANTPKYFFEIKGPHIAAPVLYSDSLDVKIKRMINL